MSEENRFKDRVGAEIKVGDIVVGMTAPKEIPVMKYNSYYNTHETVGYSYPSSEMIVGMVMKLEIKLGPKTYSTYDSYGYGSRRKPKRTETLYVTIKNALTQRRRRCLVNNVVVSRDLESRLVVQKLKKSLKK